MASRKWHLHGVNWSYAVGPLSDTYQTARKQQLDLFVWGILVLFSSRLHSAVTIAIHVNSRAPQCVAVPECFLGALHFNHWLSHISWWTSYLRKKVFQNILAQSVSAEVIIYWIIKICPGKKSSIKQDFKPCNNYIGQVSCKPCDLDEEKF